MKHYCGIDWASDHHDVSIVNESGREVNKFGIDDDLNGYQTLSNTLKSFHVEIPIAIEAKDNLLINFLIAEGYEVYSINPKSAERYKDRYNVAGNKTDEIDSFALADMLRTDMHKYRPLEYSSEKIRKLKILCGEYSKLMKDKNMLESQLYDVLSKYYPITLTLFSSYNCKTLYKLILKYSAYEELRMVSYEDLEKFLKENRYRKAHHIKNVYNKIQGNDYYALAIFDETFSHTARALVKMLLILEDEIKEIKDKMTEITTTHPLGTIFYSLPGSGEILAPKLLSIMGDNKKVYLSSSEIQAYSGVAPVTKRSGKSSRVKFRYACNKEYRNTLTTFAFCSLNWSPWARGYYDKARQNGKRHYESLRLLAYKWTRIIFKLWQTGEMYNEEYHTKNLERFSKIILKIA